MWVSKHFKGFTDQITRRDLSTLKSLIDKNNHIAEKANRIPERVRGDHVEGNRLIQKYYRQVSLVLEQRLSDGKSFKDWLNGESERLTFSDYHLLRDQYPIPCIALARVDQTRRSLLIREHCYGSSEAFHPYSPATPRLLTDQSQKPLVNGIDLEEVLDEAFKGIRKSGWKRFQCHDHFVRIEHQKHYLLEKNDFFEMAAIAELMGLDGVIRSFRLKIFCDYIMNPPAERRMKVDMEFVSLVENCGFGTDVPEKILSRRPFFLDRSEQQEIRVVTDKLMRPLRQLAEYNCRGECMLYARSIAGVMIGAHTKEPALAVQQDISSLEILAGECAEKILSVLANARKGPIPKDAGDATAAIIDVADLDSWNPFRKLMAAAQIQEEVFPTFIEQSGLGEFYESREKELPDCPMPFEGFFPIAMRQKAALFAKMIADLKHSDLPSHLFEFKADPDRKLTEGQIEAYKSLHNTFSKMFGHWLTANELLDKLPHAGRLFDAWATLIEKRHAYVGHGVDSVGDLLFPMFFFSATRFSSLLEGENPSISGTFLDIQMILRQMVPDIRNKKWAAVKEKVDLVFQMFHEITFEMASRLDPEEVSINNPFPFAKLSPFSPPGYFSKKTLLVEDASAPVELVVAPPGNPHKYQALVHRNAPYINMLRKLHARPMEQTAIHRGFAKSGPLFDLTRLHLYQLGHCIYSTVDFQPEGIAGKKYLICILFDFSGSMGMARVKTAKDISVILSEGLRENFDLQLYMYNTAGGFYRLTEVFDSKKKSVCGTSGLASICRQGLDSGDGWNPDAAMLLTMRKMLNRAREDSAIIVHLGDHEYCGSLTRQDCQNAHAEVVHAAGLLVNDGHRYVAVRVGTDTDPFKETRLPHEYLFFPDEITDSAISALYRSIARASGAVAFQ